MYQNREKLAVAVLLFTFLLITSSCKTMSSRSEIKFELDESVYGGLTHQVFEDSIDICLEFDIEDEELEDFAKQSVRKFILAWLEPMRELNSRVSDKVEYRCPGHAKVSFLGDLERSYTATGSYPEVFLNHKNRRLPYVLIHELGHTFGLKDTYVEGTSECKEGQPPSVMCNMNTTFLQDDDIEGAKAIFKQIHPDPDNEDNALSTSVVKVAGNPDKSRIVVTRNNVSFRFPSLSEYLELSKSASPELLEDIKTAVEVDDPVQVFQNMSLSGDINRGIDLGFHDETVLERIAKALYEKLFKL